MHKRTSPINCSDVGLYSPQRDSQSPQHKIFPPPVTRSTQTTYQPPTLRRPPETRTPMPYHETREPIRAANVRERTSPPGIESQAGQKCPAFSKFRRITLVFATNRPEEAGQICPAPPPKPRTRREISPATRRSTKSAGPPNSPPHPPPPSPSDSPAPRRSSPDRAPAGSAPPADMPRPVPESRRASPRSPGSRSAPSACRARASSPPSPPSQIGR